MWLWNHASVPQTDSVRSFLPRNLIKLPIITIIAIVSHKRVHETLNVILYFRIVLKCKQIDIILSKIYACVYILMFNEIFFYFNCNCRFYNENTFTFVIKCFYKCLSGIKFPFIMHYDFNIFLFLVATCVCDSFNGVKEEVGIKRNRGQSGKIYHQFH